jgi:hypothetical protein
MLDYSIEDCAKAHCDKHVTKMILEAAQLLCTAVNVLADKQVSPYKTTHVNHPCAKWVRESRTNAIYLYRLMAQLNQEYHFRYGKQHLSYLKLEEAKIFNLILEYISEGEFTLPPKAMPDEYKTDTVVESYRNYYREGKKNLHKWTKRGAPSWL